MTNVKFHIPSIFYTLAKEINLKVNDYLVLELTFSRYE